MTTTMLVPQLPTASPPLQLTELTLVWHGGAWTLPRLSWTRPDHHREDRKRARPRPEYCLVQSLTIVRVIPGSHGRYYCATSNTFSHLNGLPSVTVSVVIVVDFLVRLLFLSRSLLQTSPSLSHQDGDLSTILTAIKDQKVFQSMPCMALEVPHECLPRCPSTSPWHKSSITFQQKQQEAIASWMPSWQMHACKTSEYVDDRIGWRRQRSSWTISRRVCRS